MEVTAAHGAELKIGDGASPEVFTAIPGIFDGPNGPGFNPTIIEARFHSSTNVVKKASTVDITPVTFSIYYDSTNAQHQALRDAAKNKTLCNFKEVLADAGAEQYAYSAFVGFEPAAPVGDFNVAKITLYPDISPAIT